MSVRHTFVSMLFALAIAETATLASTVVGNISIALSGIDSSISFWEFSKEKDFIMFVPILHLILVFLLICSSWIGWSKSIKPESSAEPSNLEDIFSIPFVLFMIELMLVIIYFILARSIELNSHDSLSSNNSHLGLSRPSASPEAFWLVIVYLGYVTWDILNDCLPRNFPNNKVPEVLKHSPLVRAIGLFLTGFITRCWVSLVCAFAAWLVYQRAQAPKSETLSTIFGDLALICVVGLFWLAKILEPVITEKVFPFEKHRKSEKRKDVTAGRGIGLAIIILLFLFFWLSM